MRLSRALLTAFMAAGACGCQLNLAFDTGAPAEGLRSLDPPKLLTAKPYNDFAKRGSSTDVASATKKPSEPTQVATGWQPTGSTEENDVQPVSHAGPADEGPAELIDKEQFLPIPPAPAAEDSNVLESADSKRDTDSNSGDDEGAVNPDTDLPIDDTSPELEQSAFEFGQVESDQADSTAEVPPDRYPIDLPTALRLAGAENWTVRLAYERVVEAWARFDKASVMWLPSLNAGIGYNKHDGQIQATNGQVVDISRNSLFVGGGLGTGAHPLTGGSGGPARFFVDLSLADAIFEPLAERQLVTSARATHASTFNDTLLEAAVAYYELLGAQGELAAETQNAKDAEDVLTLTDAFVRAGKGSEADTARVEVEASNRRQAVVGAQVRLGVASAELARILQLDSRRVSPDLTLFPLDETPLAIELVDATTPLPALVALGLSSRPEIRVAQAEMEASCFRAQAERWRPFIPNLVFGASSGGFGGDQNDDLSQLDGRADVDVLAVWQVKNLGYGNKADIRRQNSRYRQNHLNLYRVLDQVETEVSQAYHQAVGARRQIDLAEENVGQAENSFRRNIARIRGLEGLPLEALQALQATATARTQLIAAITKYNKAQARLLRAIGQSITDGQ